MAVFQGTGCGYSPCGSGPCGRDDLAEQLVIKSFSETYLTEDDKYGGVLKHYLQTIKSSVSGVVSGIDEFDTLVDPLNVREDILRYLGSTIDVIIDDAEPKEYARSLVNNAVVYYQIKGTDKSYKIRGKISGFDVTVQNLWHIDYAYTLLLPDDDVFEIPPNSGEYYTTVAPGSVSGIPEVGGCGYCLTTFIKVVFLVVKPLPPSTSVNFFDRVIKKLKDITPIHVRDILYELSIIILIDENQYLDFPEMLAQEELNIPMHVFYRFDAIPADLVFLDQHGYVSGGF